MSLPPFLNRDSDSVSSSERGYQVINMEEVELTGEVEPLSTFSPEDSNGFREHAHQAIIQLNEKNEESLQPKLKVSGEAIEIPVAEACIGRGSLLLSCASLRIILWYCSK